MDTKYNGWSNYETWVVNLWIDNEQGSQEMFAEWMQEALDEAGGDKDEAERELADRLEAMHDEAAADLVGITGVFQDLLGHALGCVDWREIAAHILADAEWDNKPDADEADAE